MEEISQKIKRAVETLFGVEVEPVVSVAPENTGADYATNVAMQLAKLVHKAPMVIAEMLKPELENVGLTVEIAMPGFVNFTIASGEVLEQVKRYAEDLPAEVANAKYQGQVVVVEFSDPNPFKVLHVGHFYTSVVGDSISRLLEYAGAKVMRANFGGDVGLHVAKTLYSVLATCNADAHFSRITLSESATAPSQDAKSSSVRCSALPRTSSKNEASLETLDLKNEECWHDLTIEDIAQNYIEGTRAYDEDEVAKAEITKLNKEIYRINAEDVHGETLADLYWRGRELSYQYFDEFYDWIGVKFDKYYPESTVADRGMLEVRAHTGTTYEESDGAVVYKGEKIGLHTRVFINREGVPTYETKDVGLLFTKWDDWHFDESIVVTGNEQTDYMKVVLASVSEYAPQLVEKTKHLTHGMVRLPGNVKMSSRKGNFLKAVDVIKIIEDRMIDNGQTKDEMVALAAIKYAFLKYKMGGDIVFDPQESVSYAGNSGVYLLYSAVRAQKVLQKCTKKMDDGRNESSAGQTAQEKVLCKKIVQYKDVLSEAVMGYAPYKVCAYLYELSQEFSRFYEHVKVAGSEREVELAQVVRAYRNIMEHGLGLLGIVIPEEM